MARLDEADVPHAPVLTIGESLEQPHARERRLIREIDQPGAGTVRVPGPVVKFLASDEAPELAPAPALGEHSREVLAEILGLADGEIDELVAAGIVGEAAAVDDEPLDAPARSARRSSEAAS
jgi:formyl-CoA transferase/CoA:oxalate CoA-transferase